MSDTRRTFLRSTLAATGGLLLPLNGTGAIALNLDAPRLPVSAVPLPLSSEALKLRRIKTALRAIRMENSGPSGPGSPWANTMTEYTAVADQVVRRPVQSWADCVELAEIAWHGQWKNDGPDGRPRLSFHPSLQLDCCWTWATIALIEGVLTLGKGERNDPRWLTADEAARLGS